MLKVALLAGLLATVSVSALPAHNKVHPHATHVAKATVKPAAKVAAAAATKKAASKVAAIKKHTAANTISTKDAIAAVAKSSHEMKAQISKMESDVQHLIAEKKHPPKHIKTITDKTKSKKAASASQGQCVCNNSCKHAKDGSCDDGGHGSQYSFCAPGTDCDDCGPSTRTALHPLTKCPPHKAEAAATTHKAAQHKKPAEVHHEKPAAVHKATPPHAKTAKTVKKATKASSLTAHTDSNLPHFKHVKLATHTEHTETLSLSASASKSISMTVSVLDGKHFDYKALDKLEHKGKPVTKAGVKKVAKHQLKAPLAFSPHDAELAKEEKKEKLEEEKKAAAKKLAAEKAAIAKLKKAHKKIPSVLKYVAKKAAAKVSHQVESELGHDQGSAAVPVVVIQ